MSTRVLAIIVFVGILLLGGAGVIIFNQKMNVPVEQHVPFSIHMIAESDREKFTDQWARMASSDKILLKVVKKLNLVVRLEVADEQAAVAALRNRTRVALKDDGVTLQTFAAGKRRELDLVNAMCNGLFEMTLETLRQRSVPAAQ